MPFKNESQSHKGFKIPNFSPFLSKAAKLEYAFSTWVVEGCVDPARCSKLLWTIDSLYRLAHFGEWNGAVGALVHWTPTAAVLGRSGCGHSPCRCSHARLQTQC